MAPGVCTSLQYILVAPDFGLKRLARKVDALKHCEDGAITSHRNTDDYQSRSTDKSVMKAELT